MITVTKKRTLLKIILLRIIVFVIISISTVFIFKQSLIDGIEFAILDVIVEFLTHYIYDRVWLKIKWGLIEKEKPLENDEETPDKKEVIFTI
tara:strand:+ start:243 stop:518 length:276 start_codon:yes stop_codon:yes gene_type:complete